MTVLEAARALQAARVKFADAFLRWRLKVPSDGQAEQHAIIETNSEMTVAEANLRIALWAMEFDLLTGDCDCACEPAKATADEGPAGKARHN